MSWGWLIAAIITWILSAACIIGTIYEFSVGKAKMKGANFWGGIAFHGVTAILALWFLLKALGKA